MPSNNTAQILSSLSIPVIMVNSFASPLITNNSNPNAKNYAAMSIPRSSTLLELSSKEIMISDLPTPKSAASCPSLQILIETDVASLELSDVSSHEESYSLPDEELIPIKQGSLKEQLVSRPVCPMRRWEPCMGSHHHSDKIHTHYSEYSFIKNFFYFQASNHNCSIILLELEYQDESKLK